MSTDSAFPTPNNLGIAVYSNNAEAIGTHRLVRINRIIQSPATVLAKVESRNPAFSVKCRIGAALIADAEARGVLKAGMHIVRTNQWQYRHCFGICCCCKRLCVNPDYAIKHEYRTS